MNSLRLYEVTIHTNSINISVQILSAPLFLDTGTHSTFTSQFLTWVSTVQGWIVADRKWLDLCFPWSFKIRTITKLLNDSEYICMIIHYIYVYMHMLLFLVRSGTTAFTQRLEVIVLLNNGNLIRPFCTKS